MTRRGRVVVAVCTVAILLVLAWMVGTDMKTPGEPGEYVTPMTPQEEWGS